MEVNGSYTIIPSRLHLGYPTFESKWEKKKSKLHQPFLGARTRNNRSSGRKRSNEQGRKSKTMKRGVVIQDLFQTLHQFL